MGQSENGLGLMLAGIFSRTYAAKGEAVFAAIKADGFSAAQLNLSSLGLESLPASLPEDVVLKAKADAIKRSVVLVALSGTYNMAHPDAAYRKAQRAKFVNVVQAAKLMDIGIVSLCTGSRDQNNMWAYHADNYSPEAWRDFRSELGHVLALADGLTLAIEPEPSNVVRDAKVARRLLDEVGSSHLKIILDAANLIGPDGLARQHQIMAEAFELLGQDVVLAHAKDIDAAGQVVAPGQGAVDLKAFAQGLKRLKFSGALVGHGFEEKDAKAAALYLKSIA
ncbi:MAG: sugar phosphate isomerase/epimerase family protein [Aestuariivirga sp.]